MSILIHKETKVLVQGITGSAGSFHARQCLEYGTQIVGGVTPGKGGNRLDQIPVFDTVQEAVADTGADASMIFVPAPFAADAILEAASAGISLIACITEGIPVLDIARTKAALASSGWKGRLIGPNGPGLITPGQCKIGIMPGYIHKPGTVGILSRSGTLTYEAVWQLSQRGIGQSTVIGIGGDPVKGTTAAEALELFHHDPDTHAVLYLGEIGGSEETFVAEYASRKDAKPVAALIVGRTAPPGKKMGHAAALIGSRAEGHAAKQKMLRDAGVFVADGLREVVAATQSALASRRQTAAIA